MKKVAIVVGVLAVLGLAVVPFLTGPSDEKMIKDALKESIQASREGRPGGVMQYLSHSLTYNDEEAGDRAGISDYIKRAKPEVVVLNDNPVIDGNRATIVSPVDVNLVIGPLSTPVHINQAEIVFAKETGYRFLILPAPVWRIRSITAKEIDTSQFQY